MYRYIKEKLINWKNDNDRKPLILRGARQVGKTYITKEFGDENYETIKKLIETREKLKPYTIKYMDIASATGAPIMRPMFFDFHEDEICYTLEDQYMYGEDILFAPIMEKDSTERKVYLPKGNWVLTKDKTVYTGGQWITVHAELNEYIAFVKEGSEVLSVFE